ncbi:MAG TPA: hypothetical protein PKZ24_01915, partial [Nitrospirales bacterium]|nr:hypothetical protein [Nitrospirales bacterium]
MTPASGTSRFCLTGVRVSGYLKKFKHARVWMRYWGKTMIIVESVLGNVKNPDWKGKLDHAQVDVMNLDQWQAQKTR